MDWKITAFKALKTAAVIAVAAFAESLVSSGFSQALSDAADALASAVPYVGGLVAPALKSFVLLGVATVSAGLLNAIKHWND